MSKYVIKCIFICFFSLLCISLSGCNTVNEGKRIVRIAHSQSETHPDHIGLLAFEKYVEDRLGDKYDVQIFPNELLGASVKAIELAQTGAIDFVVCSTGNLETFDDIYSIFSIPYLFDSTDTYYASMEDSFIRDKIYTATRSSGFEAVTWLDAGTRNFYTTKPVKSPDDLKGLKLRVQQSPSNVSMVKAFGAAAAPMSFGEVYTAIQQGVIDGAENNELALTNNKHGEVAKYYIYDRHQMVPDMMIGNVKFLDSLDEEERKIFDEAAALCTKVEREEWIVQIDEAKRLASEMGVNFSDVDVEQFKSKVIDLQKQMVNDNEKLAPIYERIQEINREVG
ncbi:MAG: TRAP transporter substrate-binding protein [Clostridia bacterium]|nr:TRAP transporter substrate-binding protein [Clostridia bacterium]